MPLMVVALVASNSANNLPVRFRKKKCHISDSSHQVRGRRYCIEETSASVLRPKRLERCGQTMADVFHVRLRGLSHADRKSTRLNSSHRCISYAVFCLK